jgi:N-methylhydantoinase A
MELLGMQACIVPLNPGNLSAFGLLAVDWRTDHIATQVQHEDALEPRALESIYRRLEDEAAATLVRDGIDRGDVRLVREADFRYVGQSMEVRVQAPAGRIDGAFVRAVVEAFHAAHEKAFGYGYRGKQKVEAVNYCVSGFGLIDRPQLPKLATEGTAAPQSRRRVFFAGAFVDTPIHARHTLPAGARIDGPAVIEEFGSTTVVFPGQTLTVDPHGIMIVKKA